MPLQRSSARISCRSSDGRNRVTAFYGRPSSSPADFQANHSSQGCLHSGELIRTHAELENLCRSARLQAFCEPKQTRTSVPQMPAADVLEPTYACKLLHVGGSLAEGALFSKGCVTPTFIAIYEDVG